MKVIDWISWEEAESYPDSFGGLGGFFTEGMRWKDYYDRLCEEEIPYAEALRNEIIEKNIKFGGECHQQNIEGAPVFEDNTVAMFSYRGWGDLLAAIWSEHENKDYHYMDFYMTRADVK